MLAEAERERLAAAEQAERAEQDARNCAVAEIEAGALRTNVAPGGISGGGTAGRSAPFYLIKILRILCCRRKACL